MKDDVIENSRETETALKILDSLLKDSGQKTINENQIVIILDALASADNADVVARFPAVLAICARRGLALNSQSLFGRYWETSPKRQNLEKLLLASAAIFRSQKLNPPGNLSKIATSLESKYGNLLAEGAFQLSSGMLFTIEDLENSLVRYLKGQPGPQPAEKRPAAGKTKCLDVYLDRLFSPKQKELVLKKRDGLTFTKTEREYYSRIVRKKLEAIADSEVASIARSLVVKSANR
jgi:hypothetical protein